MSERLGHKRRPINRINPCPETRLVYPCPESDRYGKPLWHEGRLCGPDSPPIVKICRSLPSLFSSLMFKGSRLTMWLDTPKRTLQCISTFSLAELNMIKAVSVGFVRTPFDCTAFSQLCAILGSMKSLEELAIRMPLRPVIYKDSKSERSWSFRAAEREDRLYWSTRYRPWIRDLLTLRSPGSCERLKTLSVTSGWYEHDIEMWLDHVLAKDWESRKAMLERMDDPIVQLLV